MKKIFLLLGFMCLALAALIAGWWLWSENIKLITGGPFPETRESKIKANTVLLAVKDILIFKTPGGEFGAIRFDRMTEDWGADYTTWFLAAGDKSTTLTFVAAPTYKGHLFEREWVTRTGNYSYHATDIGGQSKIQCGPLGFDWSPPTLVHFPEGFCVTVISNKAIDHIDLRNDPLEWHTTFYDVRVIRVIRGHQ
jgi:hypothetical protein